MLCCVVLTLGTTIEDVRVVPGVDSNLLLDCSVPSTATDIQWFIQMPGASSGTPLPLEHTEYQPDNRGGLTIHSVRARNEGLFHCTYMDQSNERMGDTIFNVTVLGMCEDYNYSCIYQKCIRGIPFMHAFIMLYCTTL